MKEKRVRWFVVGMGLSLLLALLLLSQPCLAADPSYQVPVGPRGLAMGGAFSSVADDATAVFWNPAGLSRIGNQEIGEQMPNL